MLVDDSNWPEVVVVWLLVVSLPGVAIETNPGADVAETGTPGTVTPTWGDRCSTVMLTTSTKGIRKLALGRKGVVALGGFDCLYGWN